MHLKPLARVQYALARGCKAIARGAEELAGILNALADRNMNQAGLRGRFQ